MTEDFLKKDYDTVESLGDLIKAREGRTSAFSQGVDSVEDIDVDSTPFDPSEELTYPHHHGQSKDQQEGIDVNLMSTPHEGDVTFDWQDSAEEQLPTDPEPSEGMDEVLDTFGFIAADEVDEPESANDLSPEIDPSATYKDRDEYEMGGG